MKKFIIPFAIMALLITSCEKSNSQKEDNRPSDYEKTILSFTSGFSDDYMEFFDVKIEGTDFSGKTISQQIKGNESLKFETAATNGECTIRAIATFKDPKPEIDTARVYTIARSMGGSIRAKSVGKDAYQSIQSFDFIGGSAESSMPGSKLLEHPEFLERRAFDTTILFKIVTKDNSVSVSATEKK